jgi:soluble lytic murein transglycosylase-like protein
MRFRLACAAALAAGLSTAAPAGALNPQHAGLQVALRAQGLYCGPIDAIVGPRTLAAVVSFQRTHDLPVTGRADERTRRALGPLGAPLFGSRQLRHGALGWDVAVLQFLLDQRGVHVPVNGYMDDPTVRGLRRYQLQLRLNADGVAGPATFAALGLQNRIPVRVVPATTVQRYLVKPGDSLTAIARRAHISVSKLARLNKLDPARPLLIGTNLRYPAAAATPTAVSATNAAAVRTSLDAWAAHYRIDPRLARALAWMESGYNNSVVSPVGAEGIMQLLPATWRYVETVLIGHSIQHDADGNVEVGIAFLRHLLDVFGGNEQLALAAWYQGERSVKTGGPLAVSKAFVADVLALRQRM